MGFIQRAGAAITYMLTGSVDGFLKTAPYQWPEWRQNKPQWNMVDLIAFIREGYSLNSLIYSAVSFKARAITQAPLRAYSGEIDKPKLLSRTHPLSRLLAQPNPFQSQMQFMMLNETYLNVAGNVFILMDRAKLNGPPTALYPLRPDRIWLIPKDGKIIGYRYVPEGKALQDGIDILPQDMLHIKLPNPLDPFEGMGFGLSPVAPLAQSGDTDNNATRFLKIFFQRGTLLGGVLHFKDRLDENVIARIKQRWREMYSGVENWATETGVVDQGGEYKRISPTFDEMGFGSIDERNETRILMPFGVPPILIGSRIGLMRSTYSNYGDARRALWEDTMRVEIDLFGTQFENKLSPSDETFVAPDFSQVPALQKNIPQLVESGHKLWTMGVPAEIAFKTVGLEIAEYPGSGIGYLPMGVRPVGEDGKPEVEPTPAALQEVEIENEEGEESEEGEENESVVAENAEGGKTKTPETGFFPGGATPLAFIERRRRRYVASTHSA